ncbi:hypothetical protein [Streptomyces sp. NPDC048644]|uniref:hypothetical protein n=1 Tax=Streptomyces sp. NPDC048644 TaxID=3365582 RepID=UPI0037148FD7
MATEDSNAVTAPYAHAHPGRVHPPARPGYGKRTAPGQLPRSADDFTHLPRREASIAGYLDRLPDGADISVKTLAKVLPDYGQCALGTALRRLSEAGHLRRITELRDGSGSPRWVTRTHFSRTPRPDSWWAALTSGDVPISSGDVPTESAAAQAPRVPTPPREPEPPNEPEPPPAPQPHKPPQPHGSPHPHRSSHPRRAPHTAHPRTPAYAALAALGRTDPRMTLSAADCAALEPLAAEWLARGATPDHLAQALTAGLPPVVHHPAKLAHSRLTTKLPPEPQPAPEPPPFHDGAPPRPRFMECTLCRAPGLPQALPGGLCPDCRNEPRPTPRGLSPTAVHAHAQRLREATRATERSHA